MRKHPLSLVYILLAVLATTFAWANTGTLKPTELYGITAAGATSLGVEAAPLAPLSPASPAGTEFTYQGQLQFNNVPANGEHDFTFKLFDAASGGTQVGSTLTQLNQQVTDGLFTTSLDFGVDAFPGEARWLEIAVRQAGIGTYDTLGRQPLTAAPYALFALKTKGYKNVVTVAKEGGDYTSVTAALTSITTNSATNRYLVWVGPGVYTETVTMKQWVDIEGSGEETTKITFSGSPFQNAGTVVGKNNAELRSLTVENTGGSTYATAIYNDGASPSLLHVTATASGGFTANVGVYNYSSSSPTMNNMTVTASGGAVYNVGVWNFVSSSPTMNNVTIIASGGREALGVDNTSGSPTMNNVTVTASGGSRNNLGVSNGIGSPTMNNMTVTASGGSSNTYGMYNSNGSPTMNNVTVTASGGSGSNRGVYNFSSSTTINNSTVTGSTNAIDASGGTVKVGASNLNGGPVSNITGSVTCAGVYDENYAFFASTCP